MSHFVFFSHSPSLCRALHYLCLSFFLPPEIVFAINEISLHHNAKSAPARPGKSESELSSQVSQGISPQRV